MRKTLLVTDDALIIREMIKDAATEAGWEIAGEAVNGQDAIDKYQELKPDAVTLDMVMPDYDGIHALRGIIKADPQARVCVVSALDQTKQLKEACTIGRAHFLVTPCPTHHPLDTSPHMRP